MGSIKVGVLEIDGSELEYLTEMDLVQALNHVGYNPTGYDEDRILTGWDSQVLVDFNGNVLVRE